MGGTGESYKSALLECRGIQRILTYMILDKGASLEWEKQRNKQDSFRGEALHFGSPALTTKARQACSGVKRKRSPHPAPGYKQELQGCGETPVCKKQETEGEAGVRAGAPAGMCTSQGAQRLTVPPTPTNPENDVGFPGSTSSEKK